MHVVQCLQELPQHFCYLFLRQTIDLGHVIEQLPTLDLLSDHKQIHLIFKVIVLLGEIGVLDKHHSLNLLL